MAGDQKIEVDMAKVQSYLRKNTEKAINELRKETEGMLDKERVERIQGDGATVRSREIAVTTLSTELSEKILSSKDKAVNEAKEMVEGEAQKRAEELANLEATLFSKC